MILSWRPCSARWVWQNARCLKQCGAIGRPGTVHGNPQIQCTLSALRIPGPLHALVMQVSINNEVLVAVSNKNLAHEEGMLRFWIENVSGGDLELGCRPQYSG